MNRIRMTILAIMLVTMLVLSCGSLAAADPAARLQLSPYKKIKLDNGMTILLMERHGLPLVDFRWLMKSGGSISDPEGKEGLAWLTANLLRKGTVTRNADQISEALDFVGALFNASASKEYSAGAAEFLKKDLELGLDLVSELLLRPTFPQPEVEKLSRQSIDAIREAKAVPQRVIQNYYEAFLFGSHPYGRPTGGTETSLAAISREDIAKFYNDQYAPNEMIFAVVGDFSAGQVEAQLKEKFGDWRSRKVTLPPVKEAPVVEGKHLLLIDKPDATQTFFRLGNVGLARTSPDWIPTEVVNTLFGGRFTSMLSTSLRIKSGLTYHASSSFAERRSRGVFTIDSYTPTETTGRAINMALGLLKQLHEKGITEEQLKSAKTYIKGQFGPTIETNDQLADTIGELEFYGLDERYINTYFDKIDAVTLGDAQRVIQAYFPVNNWVIALIGKGSEIEPVAIKLAGDFKRKSITAAGF